VPLGLARDDRGEDGLLVIGGRSVSIQIVTIPTGEEVWRGLSRRGSASQEGSLDDAVLLVRHALEHKAGKARGTLLALDAAHLGAIVGPRLVEAYRSAYGDPEEEFNLIETWIIGPSVRSSIRIGSRSAA
jgi:hypothetical protein